MSDFLAAVHDLAPVLVVGVLIGMAAYVVTVIVGDLAAERDALADLLLAGDDWDDEADEPTPLPESTVERMERIRAVIAANEIRSQQLDRAVFEASVLADIQRLDEVNDR